jgi:hypothetical protein
MLTKGELLRSVALTAITITTTTTLPVLAQTSADRPGGAARHLALAPR